MFADIAASIRRWRERYAHWAARGYLNPALARHLGHAKGKKYEWHLHSNSDTAHNASWRALMWGEDPARLIAYTSVTIRQGKMKKEVTVGAWIDCEVAYSHWEVVPRLTVITEVLPKLPLFRSDWNRDPLVFIDPKTFREKTAQC